MFIQAVMRHATSEPLPEGGIYYGEIPELPEVWASASTQEEVPAVLQDALEGWIALGCLWVTLFPRSTDEP